MELATLALVFAGISIVLQLVILGFVIMLSRQNGRKKEKSLPTSLVGPVSEQNRAPQNHRRDQENRSFRRPPAEQRPAPATLQGPSNPSVDKSLRDINLRLKNAEHNQENERKRINNNFSRDNHGDHGDRDNRDNRGDRGNRGYNRGGRPDWKQHNRSFSENRGQYNTDHQDLGDRRPVSFEQTPAAATTPVQDIIAAPVFEQPTLAPTTAPMIAPPVIAPVSSAVADVAAENNQDIFHGRKTMVKRRMLGSDQAGSTEPGSTETGEPGNSSDSAPVIDSSLPAGSSITFGRRRG